jgi:hypothetical protein
VYSQKFCIYTIFMADAFTFIAPTLYTEQNNRTLPRQNFTPRAPHRCRKTGFNGGYHFGTYVSSILVPPPTPYTELYPAAPNGSRSPPLHENWFQKG